MFKLNVWNNKLFFAICKAPPPSMPKWVNFTIDKAIKYHSFCYDFGPFNLADTYRFCVELRNMLASNDSDSILLYTTGDSRQAANCALLLAAFLLMELDYTPEDSLRPFTAISGSLRPFRDASYSSADFLLSVDDCLHGIARARRAGLIDFREGSFDVAAYDHYEDPANADLHIIVPGKLVAFRGPRDFAEREGQLWADLPSGERAFHPAHYLPIFRELGVTIVLRLNELSYSTDALVKAGVAVFALPFADCTPPPLGAVFRFFQIVDEKAGGGAVAVHCHAGLGRTGTLIALWLMRSHSFTAREAIGWLRIVRPGSIIGPQQHYLVSMEPKMVRWGALGPRQRSRLLERGCAATDGWDESLAAGRNSPAAASESRSSPAGSDSDAAATAAALAKGSARRAAARIRAGAQDACAETQAAL